MIETKSPQEMEIPSALWTRQAARELIQQQVGIRMPIRTVGEYLRRWGFTPQKPVRKAYKQDQGSSRMAEEGVSGDRTAGGEGGRGDSLGR